jgi:hypothetical protein
MKKLEVIRGNRVDSYRAALADINLVSVYVSSSVLTAEDDATSMAINTLGLKETKFYQKLEARNNMIATVSVPTDHMPADLIASMEQFLGMVNADTVKVFTDSQVDFLTLNTYFPVAPNMKTVQEGSLADAYKRALDTANTTAIYVSYEDIEETHQAVESIHEDLELDEDRIQSVLEEHNSSVMLVGFEPEDTMAEIVDTLRGLSDGTGVIAFVTPVPEIVQAIKEMFSDQAR